jgi:Phosphatidylserine/phosphatidylglycerophosphate/cardiolipin synthases and related enzymes
LFDQLLADIQHAKHSIHIEFYTFYNDQIGNQIREALELQAQKGLEVRVIYDSWGSMGTKRSFFDQLRQHGGEAEPFLGSWIKPS